MWEVIVGLNGIEKRRSHLVVFPERINWDATFLTFGEVVFKRFQPELWVYLQVSESREWGNLSEDEALGIRNHDAREGSKLLEGAQKNQEQQQKKPRDKDVLNGESSASEAKPESLGYMTFALPSLLQHRRSPHNFLCYPPCYWQICYFLPFHDSLWMFLADFLDSFLLQNFS